MKYIFVDTDNGTATPGTPVHTSSSWPSNSDRFNSLATAIANATVIAETDSITIYCQGATDDLNNVSISDTPSATTITIVGNVTQPKFDASKFYLNAAGTSSTILTITRTTSSVTLKNLQIGSNGTVTQIAVNLAPASGSTTLTVENCIVNSGGSTPTAGFAISVGSIGATTAVKISNCLLWCTSGSTGRTGFRCTAPNTSSSINFYNNIVQGFDLGIDRRTSGGAGHLFKNNAVFNNTDDFAGGGSTVVAYNASDDGDGTNAVTGVTWTNVFTDYANNDYTVKAGNALIGTGIGPSSDANVPSVDFIGTARTGTTTDIGASMYVSSGLIPLSWTKLL